MKKETETITSNKIRSRIPGEGFWTSSSWFLLIRVRGAQCNLVVEVLIDNHTVLTKDEILFWKDKLQMEYELTRLVLILWLLKLDTG